MHAKKLKLKLQNTTLELLIEFIDTEVKSKSKYCKTTYKALPKNVVISPIVTKKRSNMIK